MARLAASRMLSGVSKSGSPAPSPITSRPAALSSRALSVTAMVGDGLTRASMSARKPIIISSTFSRLASEGGFGSQVVPSNAPANPRQVKIPHGFLVGLHGEEGG